MDYNAFLTTLIENLIASVPQLVAVISMVMYSLNNLKKQTAEFPNQLSVVKENLITDFKETKLMVQDMLGESRKTINGLVEEATTQLREEVTDVMGSMQEELKYYRETLQSVKGQANLLVKENKAMFDLVIQLVAKNPEFVKKGLASTITNSLTLTQEELKNYSVQMIDSLPLLETVLKEALVNYTQEEIDGVMESIGYEKENLKFTMKKFYRKRSKVFRGAGLATIGLTTTGGFLAYQSIIDWNNFKNDLTNFVVVNQQNIKLNLSIALPFMIGMIVFLFVMIKKNKEFFSDKISMSLLIAILLAYLIYSTVEVTLFSLIGAFTGSLIDETIFNNLAKRDKIRAGDEKEYAMEKRKEEIRLKARKEARANDDGSV